MINMDAAILKVFIPLTVSFFTGILIAPSLVSFLIKHKMWKKRVVPKSIDGGTASISASLHGSDEEKKLPRFGGIVVWGSTLITTLIFVLLARFFPNQIMERLSFLSRNQTWVPLASLLAGSLIGLIDDYLQTRDTGGGVGGGLSLKKRIIAVLLIGFVGGYWFFVKLGVASLWFPFMGQITLGWLIVPLFMIVMLAMFSGSVIDGIDGLSGGLFSATYISYSLIAFYQGQYDIAAFCGVVAGGILAFLWFNIPPARFMLAETGTLGLTVTISVVAFLTDTLPVLFIIALPILSAPISDIIQLLSKKFRGKKIFLVAPVHHHFQALGWPPYKVVMRFWVLGILFSVLGIVVAIAGK